MPRDKNKQYRETKETIVKQFCRKAEDHKWNTDFYTVKCLHCDQTKTFASEEYKKWRGEEGRAETWGSVAKGTIHSDGGADVLIQEEYFDVE